MNLSSLVDSFRQNLVEFLSAYKRFFYHRLTRIFFGLNKVKRVISWVLYRQRGRFAQPLAHFCLTIFIFFGVYLSPRLEAVLTKTESQIPNLYLASPVGALEEIDLYTPQTVISPIRGEITEYVVKEGETLSSIAKKFGVSLDTIIWANEIKSAKEIKAGQKLKIPPVTGIVHKVKRGETVYSIAKKYGVDPQQIVDFPFNTFANDETFALSVGQDLVVPNGVMPEIKPPPAPQYVATVPIQPGVAGTGEFTWPTSGYISQNFSWYHQAIDIANKDAPVVVAADGGWIETVVMSHYGYGNHLVINHGNGYKTLYAHLAKVNVQVGDRVNRGATIGRMGSSGRSTGIHLHFEIIKDGVKLNPLSVLK